MEYAYATCLLNESGEEINETNLVAVLDAAGCQVQESRVKAIVAALEDIEVGDVTGVDFDEVGSDPSHNGGPSEQHSESPAEQDHDTRGATGSTLGSELTAIETDPDSASRADDAPEASSKVTNGEVRSNATDGAVRSNATDGNSTRDELERAGSPNPDDEV